MDINNIRSNDDLKQYIIETGETPEFIFFWGHTVKDRTNPTPGVFSQWFESEFTDDDGNVYPTAEHWMMAKKALCFEDDETFKKVLEDPFPNNVKRYGRQIKNYDDKKWSSTRYHVVVDGSVRKFTSQDILKQYLLSTDNKVIVEASPYDRVWGIGYDVPEAKQLSGPDKWDGQNLLGYALMEAREIIKKDNG